MVIRGSYFQVPSGVHAKYFDQCQIFSAMCLTSGKVSQETIHGIEQCMKINLRVSRVPGRAVE